MSHPTVGVPHELTSGAQGSSHEELNITIITPKHDFSKAFVRTTRPNFYYALVVTQI